MCSIITYHISHYLYKVSRHVYTIWRDNEDGNGLPVTGISEKNYLLLVQKNTVVFLS